MPALRLDAVFGRIGGDGTGVFGRVLREGFHAVLAAEVINLAVVGRDERRAFHLVAADRAHRVVHVNAWGGRGAVGGRHRRHLLVGGRGRLLVLRVRTSADGQR